MTDGPTLVIQTAFLGDVVLTTPLLAALAERHGPVDVVTTPAAAPLIETHPAVGAVIRYDKGGGDRGLGGLWRLGARLRARRYSRAYLPHRSWRSAALALLAGAPERTGFADSPAALTYTRRMQRPPAGHEVDRQRGERARDHAGAIAGQLAQRIGRRARPLVEVGAGEARDLAVDSRLQEQAPPARPWASPKWSLARSI